MTTMTENELRTEVEAEMALDAVTIDLCAICRKSNYVSEMSECATCGHFCMKCDCHCPIEGIEELEAA